MKTILTLCAALLTVQPLLPLAANTPATPPNEAPAPKVQIALLLDTSGSMDGLLDQARTQIWQVVNTFIHARQNGQTPIVEVALYEYGNSNLDPATHWIRQLQPLTRDLDAVSESLFSLTTNGGEEYCGAVIQRATADLAWDPDPDTYKVIFIAGNEPFTQGPICPFNAARAAIARGLIVNTIHCGSEAEGVNSGWQEGALLADGRYLFIDHQQATLAIEAPQDSELAQLNQALNATYLAYGGAPAAALRQRQSKVDDELSTLSRAAMSSRVVAKATANYRNADWDLVDALQEAVVQLDQIRDEELPEPLRALAPEARADFVKAKADERAAIQARILELNAGRETYIATEKARLAAEGAADSLESAVIGAVREQAAKKGVEFDDQ